LAVELAFIHKNNINFMADKLTEKQAEFLEEIKERFRDTKWSVSVWPKKEEAPGNWNTFKLLVLDFCMENGLIILEKPDSLLIGRTYNVCEYAHCRILEILSDPKKAEVSRN
jgi:hypothetical protein